MINDLHIPEPFLFNPLKHHLGYIRDFINLNIEACSAETKVSSLIGTSPGDITGSPYKATLLVRELKHLGTSVMDVYTGQMRVPEICNQIRKYLMSHKLITNTSYSEWTGISQDCYRIIPLADGSRWTLKFHNHADRFVHFFPARNSRFSFRVKSNTLKSAMMYYILVGKDYITGDDLNRVRPLLGLSPIKDIVDAEAILEMIEILRG